MTSPAGRVVQHVRRIFGEPVMVRDAQLLERFATCGDEQAFAALVQRHGSLVLGVCRRILQSAHDAEDAFQATFLVLARRASAIRKPDSVASWLYEVAYRLARKMKAETIKRRQRQEKVRPPAPVAPADLAARELHGVLDEELRRLADKYRQPLLLCYLEGLTQEEAAAQLGWPRGTLKRRLERGRDLLKSQLARRGLGLGAAVGSVLLAGDALALPVPAALGGSLTRAAAFFAARQALPDSLISQRAVALAEGMLRALAAAKWKVLAVALVAISLLAGSLLLRARGGPLPDGPPTASAPAPALQAQPAPNPAQQAKPQPPAVLPQKLPPCAIEVTADDAEPTPQAHNRCPPPRPGDNDPRCEIATELDEQKQFI
jgi:RNA polymerase sigma factor (sigma-70 family)